jgi:hypothetical protein
MPKSQGDQQPAPGVLVRDDGQVEAVRYHLSEGARFSGWIVRSTTDRWSFSDPISTKPEAVEVLLAWETDR